MSASDTSDNDLIDHLCRHSPLTQGQARQIVAEINHYYRETLAEYVCRRHKELQQQGYSNSAIYSALIEELPARRFAQAPLSERQVRRLIYG